MDKYVRMFIYNNKEVLLNVDKKELVEIQIERKKISNVDIVLLGGGTSSVVYAIAKQWMISVDSLWWIYILSILISILWCIYMQRRLCKHLNARKKIVFNDRKLKNLKPDINLGIDRTETSIVGSLFLFLFLGISSFFYTNIFVILGGIVSIFMLVYTLFFILPSYKYMKALVDYIEER